MRPSKIVLLEMFNTFWGLGKFFWILIKIDFDWRESVFGKIWNHWHAFHIIKTGLKVFMQKISKFSKISNFSGFDWSNLFSTNWKIQFLRLKLSAWLDSFFDSFRSIEPIFKHDSHALISKISRFQQNFEIRVYVFLRIWGFCSIWWNWVKLAYDIV